MKSSRLAAVILLLVACLLAAQAPLPSAPRGDAASRFITCDVTIDPAHTPLAAWQIDIRAKVAGGTVELVGVEGTGEAAEKPFAAPPYYDPEALTRDHVVIAAFSTAKTDALPTGPTRIARLHMRITGAAASEGARPEFTTTLITAADPTGAKFTPTVRASLGDTP